MHNYNMCILPLLPFSEMSQYSCYSLKVCTDKFSTSILKLGYSCPFFFAIPYRSRHRLAKVSNKICLSVHLLLFLPPLPLEIKVRKPVKSLQPG